MINHIKNSLQQAMKAVEHLLSNPDALSRIAASSEIIIDAFEKGNRVFSCGNGGSMCDAIHFAEEFTGRYRKNRKSYPAIAISDPGYLSCAANDYGFDAVFSRYIEGVGMPGDCLVAISTSGNSLNVLNAVKAASAKGMKSIALTGRGGTDLEKSADICIVTPAGAYADRVQEMHIKILHIIIEMVERRFHPENY